MSHTASSSTIPTELHHALRTILTSLLLSTPPALTPSQLSPDLTMRHRMLSLPATAPPAYDFAEHPLPAPTAASVSDRERVDSQTNFFSYLSRPPVELTTNSAATAEVGARELFHRRVEAMRLAMEGERDPVDLNEYTMWCKAQWEAAGRCCVVFPETCRGSPRLCMMLVRGDDGDVDLSLDNLFAVDDWDEVVRQQALHLRSAACAVDRKRSTGHEGEEGEEGGGVEYIADADDFWAGYSDEDEPATEAQPVAAGKVNAAAEHAPQVGAGQDDAIRDIVRGAFTLYRTLHPTKDAQKTFLALVQSAISPVP